MSSLTLSEGAVFAGRYQIVRCIAQGGMGAVYEVIHIETERRRALKVMLPSFLQSDEMRARFRQEARVTARIASEYIVDVLDAGIDDATQMPFLVMELLEGEELEQRLKRRGPLEPLEVITYLHQASLALDKTHRASIVHRDLKPGNLFLTEREDGAPRIKVLDFGIAKLIAEGATGPATQLLGTPIFMAPEQFQIGARITPAVDIFALGMIAFTLLTGKPYWYDEASVAPSMHAVYAAIMQGPREPACARATRRGVALPPAFDSWFAKVTAFAPQDRFPTALAAIAALGEVFGVAVAQRSSTFTGVEPRPAPGAPAPPSPQPLAPAGVAHAQQARPPERISSAPAAGASLLGAGPTVPLAQTPAGPARSSAEVASGPAREGAGASTTSAVSNAVLTTSKARGPGVPAAIALAAALVVALIAGSFLLMRAKGGGALEGDATTASEGISAPTGRVIAGASSTQAPLPSSATPEPAPSQTAVVAPPADPTSTAAPKEAAKPKATAQPGPAPKPVAPAKPPPAGRKPAIQFD
jgi:serine/threonine protein kinase